jgi:phosphate transport system protein
LTVDQQVIYAMDALFNQNTEIAELVDSLEKTVNKKELLIDKECEKNLALYGPVANDLRFILSLVEMNTHLERIGDMMHTIALNVIETPEVCSSELLEALALKSHFTTLSETYKDTMESFVESNIEKASHIFITNRHTKKALRKSKVDLAALIKSKPKDALIFINTHTNMRMLIRFGDMIDNLMEEIVFYQEAVVLKHKKKKHKKVRRVLENKEEESASESPVSNEDQGFKQEQE